MTHSRRDKNEREIVDMWRGLGCIWIPQARTAGFDGLLCWRGRAHIVEIKSSPKAGLTAAEKEQRERVQAAGLTYNIIRSLEDALALVEAE